MSRKAIPPPMLIREQDMYRTIIEAAEIGGWLCYHTHDSRRSAPGFPDFVLVRPPQLWAIEVKKKPRQPTREQTKWLDAFAACSDVRSAVINEDDLQRLCDALVREGSRV